MLLDVRGLLREPGASRGFETSLDLSDLYFGSSRPVSERVEASGRVRNTAGVLELEGSVHTTLHAVCDRCAAEFTRYVEYPIQAVLVEDEESDDYENPWVFELSDGQADLDDIVNTAFVLGMDSRLLCKEDCKGLCCRCGKNLNLGPCDCKAEPDPRFAALQQLLDKT